MSVEALRVVSPSLAKNASKSSDEAERMRRRMTARTSYQGCKTVGRAEPFIDPNLTQEEGPSRRKRSWLPWRRK